MRLGGQKPLFEFHKLALESFSTLERELDSSIAKTFESAIFDENGVDVDKEGLRGPSSTWTYLVNDNPFEWLFDISGMSNVGLGFAAGVWGGLFVMKAAIEKLKKRLEQ